MCFYNFSPNRKSKEYVENLLTRESKTKTFLKN